MEEMETTPSMALKAVLLMCLFVLTAAVGLAPVRGGGETERKEGAGKDREERDGVALSSAVDLEKPMKVQALMIVSMMLAFMKMMMRTTLKKATRRG